MGLFERYLTLWVALCIIAGIALGQAVPAVFHAIGAATVAEVNLPVAVLVWLMIIPMLLKIDLAALGQVSRALARHRRDGRRQLAGEAFLDGAARLAVHRAFVSAVPARRSNRRLYRRIDPAGGGSLHGHGVRLVEPRRGRAAFHAVASRAQRLHHDRGLRADRRAVARPVLHHRAVEHAAAVGRALHRRAGDRRATLAARAAGARRASGAWTRRCTRWRRCRFRRCC